MSNDNGLVDEFENLENQKKEIELKEEELKKKIIELAKQKDTSVLFGIHKKCSIKEYEKVIYPENKDILIKMIKERGLYGELSHLNYPKLSSKIVRNEIDRDIAELTRKEKAYMVSLKEIEK